MDGAWGWRGGVTQALLVALCPVAGCRAGSRHCGPRLPLLVPGPVLSTSNLQTESTKPEGGRPTCFLPPVKGGGLWGWLVGRTEEGVVPDGVGGEGGGGVGCTFRKSEETYSPSCRQAGSAP